MRPRSTSVQGSPVVVISGAASGIGEDAALFLNQLGYLVAAGVRSPADGDRLRSQATAPDRLHPIEFDVTRDDEVEQARRGVEDLVASGRRFAGVFSNAGIVHYEGDTSSEGTPMTVIEQVMDVNFFGAIRFVRAFLPLARRSRGTVVVNSALMARTVLPYNAGYAPSKCALEGWCDALRREAGPTGVRVVLIEAAAISTGLVGDQSRQVSDDNPYPEQRPFLESSFRRMASHRDDPHCAPRRVSELVAHALQTLHPRARYHVGGGARAIATLGHLPDGVQDRLLRRLVSSSQS